ncbi:MAG: SDR family oxidoreductase [Candidatus Anammoximicrobium sp.]|nr:SDR family oxidoreductase [Candidatus Anammoximicrobium sp.]
MKNYIRGKVVVITGGTSGFGLSAAELLLEQGAKVVITGRNLERLQAAEKQLAHDSLLAVRADAVSTADWKETIRQTLDRFGRIDVLVNNHGAGVKIADVEQMSDEDLQTVIDVNLTSVMKGCREVIPVMKLQGSGHIINVSSGCAYHSWPKWAVYTAAKEGMVGFTRCLHLEMSEWGGKATSFIPGAARTGFCEAAGIDDSWLEGFPGAEDFARTLVHCIDVPDNSFIEEVNIWGTKQVKQMVVPF